MSSLVYIFLVALQPNAGYGLLIHEVYRSHTTITTVGRTPLDELSASRRDLYTTLARDRHP